MHPLLERGEKRFKSYAADYSRRFGHPLTSGSSILDFGCGAGGFLLQAAMNGFDCQGVEVMQDRLQQFQQISPPEHVNRFNLYDGNMLPFSESTFDLCYSWFVFEHVPDTGLSLREIVRVTKPGGIIDIHADDARNGWDGHAAIPWPPYMPRCFTKAYLDAFGLAHRADFINETVVYITGPEIAGILNILGCEVLYVNSAPTQHTVGPLGVSCSSDEQAFQLGLRIKCEFENGTYKPPVENLRVVARKN